MLGLTSCAVLAQTELHILSKTGQEYTLCNLAALMQVFFASFIPMQLTFSCHAPKKCQMSKKKIWAHGRAGLKMRCVKTHCLRATGPYWTLELRIWSEQGIYMPVIRHLLDVLNALGKWSDIISSYSSAGMFLRQLSMVSSSRCHCKLKA